MQTLIGDTSTQTTRKKGMLSLSRRYRSGFIFREKISEEWVELVQRIQAAPTSHHSFLPMSRRFRLRTKALFITYPQCDLPKELVLEAIQSVLTTATNIMIAQEQHKEGGLHLHILVLMKDSLTISNPSMLDIWTHHPNLQACRNVPKSLVYLTKEDSEPLVWPDDWNWKLLIEAQTKKKSVQALEVAKALENGSSLMDLNQTHPDFLLMNLPKVRTYQAFLESMNGNQASKIWGPPNLSQDPITNQIGGWLNTNIRNQKPTNKHLWLWGPTGTGKSHLCMKLDTMLDIYWFPDSEDFHDLFSNDKDLIVMDDLHANWMTVNKLIKWASPTALPLKIKGGQIVKKKHIPILISSNLSPDEMFWRVKQCEPSHFQALLRRFLIVNVQNEMKFEFN